MLPKKHLFGSEKGKKRNEELIKSQHGPLDKFVFKKVDTQENVPNDVPSLENNNNENLDHENENEEIDDNSNVFNDVSNAYDIENLCDDCEQEIPHIDIYDPRNWENFDNTSRDILVEKGHTREMNLNFSNDKYLRHFSYANYSTKLSNGEISDRKWLVYCKHVDKVYCFCCKLFKSSTSSKLSLLASEGLNDWKHISQRLKQHENGIEHMTNMNTWNELRMRFYKNQIIDKH